MTRSVLEWLEQHIYTASAEKLAFADERGSITFAGLYTRARRAGTFFLGRVSNREAVAFYLEKSVDAVCGMFGAVYAGGFYSFIDVHQPAARTAAVLSVLQPVLIVTDGEHCEKLREARPSAPVCLLEDIFSAEVREDALQERRREGKDTDPLYVNFTSGSTGVPKGVAICHRSVIDFISCFTDIFQITAADVLANQAPFDFDVSVKDIYGGLRTGAAVQLIPRPYFSVPTKLMDFLAERQATVLIWAVSAMCFVSIMNGFGYRVPGAVRLVMFSGEVMPVRQLRVWQKYLPAAAYVNLYGPTEITCNCTYYVIDRAFADTDVIPAGRSFPNETVFLLDEAGRLVTAPGEEGEICVSGTCVGLGYYNDAGRTAQAFVQNPLNTKYPERIYRTGDIGRYDADGMLVYVGRKDFQIKHQGHRIELGEIEAAAMSREGVGRACCLYDTAKKRLVLFYQGGRDKAELTRELRDVLPPFMIPNGVVPLDDMPLNKNGKIDRARLRELLP